MTRETKIGLFVGMGVIILIGILISDHLSDAQRQRGPQFSEMFRETGAEGAPRSDEPTAALPLDDRQLRVPGESSAPAVKQAARVTPLPSAVNDHEPAHLLQDLHAAIAVRGNTDRRPAAVEPNEADEAARPAVARSGGPLDVVPDHSSLSKAEIDRLNQQVSRNPPTRLPAGGSATLPSGANGSKRVVHYVKDRETLSEIARQYYGRTAEWHTIYQANKAVIDDPDNLSPGTRIEIPDSAPRGNASAPAPTAIAQRPAPAVQQYTLKQGETLAHVAEKFLGSQGKWREVYQLNKDRIKNPNVVAPGTVIRVPAKRN